MSNNNKFNEGVDAPYAELPVAVNYLYWKRGNGLLANLKETDPGAYFGGWSASVHGKEDDYPVLPLPKVTRTSEDGQATFERYASNVINFLPVVSRMRYELRKKVAGNDGRDEERVIAVSKEYISGVTIGYQPHKQVFGIVYSADMTDTGYGILKLNKWSAFISFNKAAQAWSKAKVDDGHLLVRRYGTIGTVNKNGATVPNFEVFNDGKSTPIEAIGVSNPILVDFDGELDELWNASQDWQKCERWNASGKIQDPSENVLPPLPETSDEFPFE